MIGRHSGLVATLLSVALLAGCAGTRPYEATSDRNVRFSTAVESGSWLSTVRATVHVHSVDPACRTTYEGTIPLKSATIVTGISTGTPRYLVIAFNSSSFLANRSGTINYATMLTPRRGYDYDIAVRYVDNTYNATIEEVHRTSRSRRELRHRPLDTCRAAG
jgi:hypothetical protein